MQDMTCAFCECEPPYLRHSWFIACRQHTVHSTLASVLLRQQQPGGAHLGPAAPLAPAAPPLHAPGPCTPASRPAASIRGQRQRGAASTSSFHISSSGHVVQAAFLLTTTHASSRGAAPTTAPLLCLAATGGGAGIRAGQQRLTQGGSLCSIGICAANRQVLSHDAPGRGRRGGGREKEMIWVGIGTG